MRSVTSLNEFRKYFVYVLLSIKDKKFYIGYSENIKTRIEEHTLGKVKSTKTRRPLKLIYYEVFNNKHDAKTREVFLKSGFGREQLKLSLKRTLNNYSESDV